MHPLGDTSLEISALRGEPEPTLGAALTRFASDELPSRFHQFLQLGIPAAYQFWAWGLPRTAAWSVVLSLFGIWALCEQALERRSELARLEWRSNGSGGVLRFLRRAAGTVAGLGAAALFAEGVLYLLGAVFKCPGCAG
jgi:hypothetical protein